MSYSLRPYQQDLIQRTREAYATGYHAPCVVSPCGSGKSLVIAEIARLSKGRVLFLVHRKELKDQIRNTFIRNGVDMQRVEIGMVQTVVRRLDKTKAPDLIITDEGHHSLANSYKKIYSHFPKAYRLGFTATPIRLNGDGLGDVYDKLIVGKSVKWLIENSYLAPYTYYAPAAIDLTHLKKRSGEYTTASIEQEFSSTIYGDVISHYRKLADGKKAICYCASVRLAEETARHFRDEGIPAEHISGNTPAEERDGIINRFRTGETLILCNVDIVGEGFDVPDCEVSILLRPTMSLSLYIQQAMRCMRYMPGKQAIILDHVGNFYEHGLPDEDRPWSLKSRAKKPAGQRTENPFRVCDGCFRVFAKALGRTCPYCGHENAIADREPEVVETAKLEEIKQDIVIDYRDPGDCRNMGELYALARNRGYKPGWAYYQGKLLGFIH